MPAARRACVTVKLQRQVFPKVIKVAQHVVKSGEDVGEVEK